MHGDLVVDSDLVFAKVLFGFVYYLFEDTTQETLSMSDFTNFTHPKAAKDYRCEWCGESIPKGEVHAHFVGVWEGEWQNWRMHDECYDYSTSTDECQDGFMPFENERPVKVSK